jgi:hypothetical protein
MSIDVRWDNDDHTIVLFTFSGSWTWRQFRDACDTSLALHREVSYPVASIYDMREGDHLPTNFFSNVRYALDVTDPPNRTPAQVVVGAGFLVKSLGEVVVRLYGKRYGFGLTFVSSLDEARTVAQAELQVTAQRTGRN